MTATEVVTESADVTAANGKAESIAESTSDTTSGASTKSAEASLAELRAEIEKIDAGLVSLLAERMGIVRQIRVLKRDMAMPVADPAREAAVVTHVARLAREAGLPENDVRELFWKIVSVSRKEQNLG